MATTLPHILKSPIKEESDLELQIIQYYRAENWPSKHAGALYN
jgi:hypothetical protein